MGTFENDNPKNLYVIRRKLAALKKPLGFCDWQIVIGNFRLSILPKSFDDISTDANDSIFNHPELDICLTEGDKNGNRSFIDLREDPRFKHHQPIIYDSYDTPSGPINFSNGHAMPISYLCELIKYLHRLSNLTAFM